MPTLIGGSLYADKLRMYYDWFPPEQFKVLLFDDLEADPKAFAGQAFDFLDLPLVDEIDYGKRLSVLVALAVPAFGPAEQTRRAGTSQAGLGQSARHAQEQSPLPRAVLPTLLAAR